MCEFKGVGADRVSCLKNRDIAALGIFEGAGDRLTTSHVDDYRTRRLVDRGVSANAKHIGQIPSGFSLFGKCINGWYQSCPVFTSFTITNRVSRK